MAKLAKAENCDTLINVIADIRYASGVGHVPMLSDLENTIKAKLASARNEALEEAAKVADLNAADGATDTWEDGWRKGCVDTANDIRARKEPTP